MTIQTQNGHLGESQQGLKYLKLKVVWGLANEQLIKELVPKIRENNVAQNNSTRSHRMRTKNSCGGKKA